MFEASQHLDLLRLEAWHANHARLRRVGMQPLPESDRREQKLCLCKPAERAISLRSSVDHEVLHQSDLDPSDSHCVG